MAAKKRTNTLSDARLARFNATADRVLGSGAPIGSTAPYGDTDAGQLWFEITGNTPLTNVEHPQRWKYAGKLYRGPFATRSISDATVYAVNSFERGANTAGGAGYTFNSQECGSPKGLKPLATTLRLLIVDKWRNGTDVYHVISLRNNPDLIGVAGVQG